ncbi:glutaminase A [Sinirhodobacter sp. WL0062]|uniref:Glutaminase n=1 Tax=Rhodobacter flavimaris TaxID=2907145 RepID=A0ABS8YT73_9RHOB|nr:glutaminase A [Sinirhodobacter sp. WL0062]MCE5973064.1 glutaminase A [Sinirhodobacter sp. WL0062]
MVAMERSVGFQSRSPVEQYLHDLLAQIATNTEGTVADYIPELAKANPEHLAVVVVTVDGKVYSAGDADVPFTIQSVSKPFMFGYALQEYGLETVLKKVGVEPTGDPFNSIVLDDVNNRPFNPMVNAGAIAMSELLRGENHAEREATQMDFFSRFAGRKLTMDQTVYQSESDTGHRNRAIAYMMLNSGMINGPTEEVLDLYFRQCSILVTARDLAVMAATLAAHGRNVITGEQVISPGNVRDVLSVMATCGMYDYAGQWMFDVGLPAKSGVSGGIIAVLPGQLGIAVYSPRLDSVGNSVRGIEVCKRFTRDFSLHAYVDRTDTRAVVRRMYHGDEVTSNRVRSQSEIQVLYQAGKNISVVEAQGPLHFGTAERLLRQASKVATSSDTLIIDFRRVAYADRAARMLLRQFVTERSATGCKVVFTEVCANDNLRGFEGAFAEEVASGQLAFVSDLDHALEAAENALLERHGLNHREEKLKLSELELFQGLSREEIAALEPLILSFNFKEGQTILKVGDEGRLIFIVARGSVSIHLGEPSDLARRIASVGPGQSFGEMALLDGGRRSANACADTPVLAYAFDVEEVRKLAQTRPRIMEVMLANMVRSLSNRLRAANDQIKALE